jgi:hypothetical protein
MSADRLKCRFFNMVEQLAKSQQRAPAFFSNGCAPKGGVQGLKAYSEKP